MVDQNVVAGTESTVESYNDVDAEDIIFLQIVILPSRRIRYIIFENSQVS